MTRAKSYQRILLKLSGESLCGEKGFGVDAASVADIAEALVESSKQGAQIAVVLGAGNLCRGESLVANHVCERVTADHMGMLATVMNAIALRDAIQKLSAKAYVMSAFAIQGIAKPYYRQQAVQHLEKNEIVLFAGGTGNPLVTTDTAAALRAIEIGADILLKATKVDGVYSDDPFKNQNATRFDSVTFQQALDQELRVMDLCALSLCRDYDMPIRVFNMGIDGALLRLIQGETIGTLVNNGE